MRILLTLLCFHRGDDAELKGPRKAVVGYTIAPKQHIGPN